MENNIFTIPENQIVEKCLTKLEEEIERFSEREGRKLIDFSGQIDKGIYEHLKRKYM